VVRSGQFFLLYIYNIFLDLWWKFYSESTSRSIYGRGSIQARPLCNLEPSLDSTATEAESKQQNGSFGQRHHFKITFLMYRYSIRRNLCCGAADCRANKIAHYFNIGNISVLEGLKFLIQFFFGRPILFSKFVRFSIRSDLSYGSCMI